MSNIRFTLRRLIVSNKHLRIIRNDFKDRYRSTKYQIRITKGKLINNPDLNRKEPVKILTEKEVNEKYEYIKKKNLSIIDLHPFKDNAPLVSIIINNKNGYTHLKRLFKNFLENISYPNYEIIIVDNASTDNSINFLNTISNSLQLTILTNTENKSFSEANNQAAEIAKGEFLLLLNNNVKPTYGWLNQMMQSILSSQNIGAVGAKLIYPDCSKSLINKNNSFKTNHEGIIFKEETDGFIQPYNISNKEPFNNYDKKLQVRSAVTASALLIKKDKYWEVGGLDERYNYGYEDVDLCLKLLRKGYNNIYCPTAILYNYEFTTQPTEVKRKINRRNSKNRGLFQQKWNQWLHKQLLKDKLYNKKIFSEYPLNVVFIVTESGEDASAGDYFTASELGKSLKKFGWNISYILKNGSIDWYDIGSQVDILISLLDVYDPRKIRCSNKSLIKIAWPRNWFERWVHNPGLSEYDLIFASSKTACSYIEEKTGLKTFLLPIATNPANFNNNTPEHDEYLSDYCFTGSYWDDHRDIIEMLDPYTIPFEFKLYGKNWDDITKFNKYYQGFINYSDLPFVYASTKIVIDDVNRGAKNFGSVNSRVFDAIATGALVITNGVIGSEETFKGKLPVWKSQDDLNNLIEYYMTHEDARTAKVKELQEFVLKNHTYENRANSLKECLEQEYLLKTRIAIKIPVNKWESVREWGDYYIALGLKKEFEKKSCEVILQILPEWDSDDDVDCDVVIVLRGLSKYRPKKMHFNILWNISHPDEISIEEYNQYDHVFIASIFWAENIARQVQVPVETMLQCTDPKLFYPDPDNDYKHDLIFVGNSRKVFRKIIRDILPTDDDLAVYGANWEEIIPKKYIKGVYIPNNELRKAYSSCKILLNDHWDDMREKGFISNRIFDGFAAGAFIISDNVWGAKHVFGDALITYDNSDELHSLIKNYLHNKEKRIKEIEKVRINVIRNHTFQKRVEHVLEVISNEMEFKSNNDSMKQWFISKFPNIYILFNSNSNGIKNALTTINGYNAIKKNYLFDNGYYLKNNPDVRLSGLDPLIHYLCYGFKEGKKPDPNFDGNYYLETYDDVISSNLNPLVHYCLYGMKEERETHKITVSIIMPTYNRKNVIEKAINSVINQTYNDYELIIVDDGSNDGTEDLIKKNYRNYLIYGKIKYFKQNNGGVSKARNKGLSEAKGNIIAYLDSDNYWLETYLERMVSALSNNNVNTAYSAEEVNDYYRNDKYIRATRYDRTLILKGNFIDLNIFVHKKFLYDKLGGFNESLNRLVDWDLILRYTKSNEPYFVDEVLAEYFISNELNNISISADLEENRLKVQKLHSIELIEKGIISSEVLQSKLIDSQKNLSNSNEKI